MNESQTQNMKRIVEAIQQRESFLVATHVRPDGDAAGSVLGLTFMLRKLGKRADPYCRDSLPGHLSFLAGSEFIRHENPRVIAYDAAVLVDCAELSRVGPSLEASVREVPLIVNIDHHISASPFGDLHWVETSASSTCEMLYDLSILLGVPLDKDMAAHMYTGILTDTGSFRFSNTNRRVLEIAMRLVAEGVRPDDVAQHIYDSGSPQRLLLLSQVLASTTFHAGNRLATAELTQNMFGQTETTPADSDGFINHLRSVKSVEMAMLFREDQDETIHVSMRSKGTVDVATFAQKYHGGGHRNAAAFRASGPMGRVRQTLTDAALNYLAFSSAHEND